MRKKLPPLNALRSFEAAARNSSFRDAAEELYVSHSAISHQIKLLEQFLGVELFVRKARAVELTKLGRAYYPVLREAFDRIAEATELVLAPQAPDVLTLQLYSTFAIRWLIPRLPDFQARFPDIRVRLNTSQFDVDFEHEDVDACVMIGSRSNAALNYCYLFSVELFPICSPTLLREGRPLLSPNDLANHTILQVYPSERDWYRWLEATGTSNVNPESGLQLDSYDHAISTALRGMGVALGMQPFVASELSSGLLLELFPGRRVRHQGDWYFVCRQGKAEQPKIDTFRQWLLKQIMDDPNIVDLGIRES